MRNDMLVARGGGSVRCRICEFNFVPEEPRDRERHKEEHEKLARGGLPFGVREFLKAFGWDTAYNNSRNRVRNKQDREVGKLAIAYSWWARARMNGINEREFDEYMAAHLHYIDADIEGDEGEITRASNGMKPWERYDG